MNIQDRINVFEMLFEELQDTNSRIDKRWEKVNKPACEYDFSKYQL